MVQDFNNLLKGEKLTGKGCGGDTPGDDDNEEEGEAKACTDEDITKFNEEVDKFVNEDVKAIQEACKEGEITKDLLRDFCVITMEIKLNPKPMAWTAEYMNHRVLVGNQAKITACNDKIK